MWELCFHADILHAAHSFNFLGEGQRGYSEAMTEVED